MGSEMCIRDSCSTNSSMCSTVFVGMEHGKGDPPPERDRRHPPHHIMSWTPGVDMPPFEVHNLQAVEFALGLAEGTVAMSAVPVSKAVAVQLWQLFCGETARRPARCKQFTFAQVRLALSALALGTPAAGMPQPLLSRMALHNELLRPAKHGAKGLVLLLKEELRLRKSHPDMKDMGLEEARAHILKKWDTELLVAAGGGGGGDDGVDGEQDRLPHAAHLDGHVERRKQRLELLPPEELDRL